MFNATTARFTALTLALVVTAAMLSGINALATGQAQPAAHLAAASAQNAQG